MTVSEAYLSDSWQLDMSLCPNSCNGRGLCSFGYCFCQDGFFGPDCQDSQSRHSTRAALTSSCSAPLTALCRPCCVGVACQSSSCSYSALSLLQVCQHCNGAGNCSFASCLCSEGFASSLDDAAAAGNQSAATAECRSASCPRDCSGHGACLADGRGGFGCSCLSGYYGLDCSLGFCSSDCNAPYGSCNTSQAACDCASSPLGLYTGQQCITFQASHAARRSSRLQPLLSMALLAAALALTL